MSTYIYWYLLLSTDIYWPWFWSHWHAPHTRVASVSPCCLQMAFCWSVLGAQLQEHKATRIENFWWDKVFASKSRYKKTLPRSTESLLLCPNTLSTKLTLWSLARSPQMLGSSSISAVKSSSCTELTLKILGQAHIFQWKYENKYFVLVMSVVCCTWLSVIRAK